MKIHFRLLLFISIFIYPNFFSTGSYLFSQEIEDPVKSYEGIPIISHNFVDIQWIPPIEQFQQADSAGIFIMIMNDLTREKYVTHIKDTRLLVSHANYLVNGENPLVRYTGARYTVFEAEGTDTADGLVTLYSDSLGNYLEKVNGYVRTKENTPHGTMIYGPMYRQCRNYFDEATNDTLPITYQARYLLRIDDLIPGSSPDDTVCILQVTTSKTWEKLPYGSNGDSIIVFDSSFVKPETIAEAIVRYGDLEPGRLDTVDIEYSFAGHHWWGPIEFPGTSMLHAFTENSEKGKKSQNCVEFKVLWRGKADTIRLSVDKVIISDERGRDLKSPDFYPGIKQSIENQIYQSSAAFDHRVGLFMGIDEPWSIDTWEPIRMVQEIVDSYSPDAKFYINFNVQADGRFNHWQDPARGSNAIVIDEFMRRVKKGKLWVTGWLYDLPCAQGAYLPPCDQVNDYRIFNIDIFADSVYKRILETSKKFPDLHYGLSVQTGKYGYAPEHTIREINSSELLYQTNLTLMYGAKILFPWLYFGGTDLIPTYTGFRNVHNGYEITDKYNTLKDTIASRLRSLLGKTLRKLTPLDQYAGSNGINYGGIVPWSMSPNGYSYIEDIHPTNTIPSLTEYGLDMGFFSDNINADKKYFMVLNRYYSQENKYTIKLKNLDGFQNWNLKNYVDSTTITKLAVDYKCSFEDTLLKGDANLYSIAPVVIDGGILIADDLTGTGITLLEDMTIENGATLYVNGDYISKANITLKNGSKIVSDENGKIIFDAGKKLIIEGNAQLNGTEENRFTLQFNSATAEGVVIKQGASLIMSYCDIMNSQTGIKSEPGAGNISISNVNISNCSNYGIALLGTVDDDGESTPPPPTIFECNISGSSTGINVVNYNEILIKSNTIENSDVGISLTQIPSAYIQGNIIIGGATTEGSGILMASCGGYIRTNTIRNHVNAIYLGNSSPAIGGNLLELNLHHGIYVGVGSVPDLTPSITGEPPLFYPASGYNKIKNNGQGGIGHLPDQNDGSEIYINNSNMLLRSGCNEIMDDRPSIPPLNTLLLMNGTYRGDERELNAEYNYWGTTEPTQDRFGDLEIIFYPYYAEVCPFPQKGNDDFVARTSSGEVVDTLPVFAGSVNLSSLELSYAQAGKYYLSGNYEQAKTVYNQIVQAEYTTEEKLTAYYKLYTIGNILNEDEQYFSDLQSVFNSISNSESDSLLITIYNHNSLLCDVSKEAYVPAITGFDNIIQQNPETEEALFAEIDILTTALKIDTTNNQLGKMVDGKYLLKNSGDYLSRMKTLMQDKFGINNETEERIIPKEYSLYQNYPNPFNPSTTIKFDLPKDGNVELIVYDILGRNVTKLVNEYRSAGSYEHRFDASNLASGIYLYQLKSGDFVSTKKMTLIK